jgi:hypothetical protein
MIATGPPLRGEGGPWVIRVSSDSAMDHRRDPQIVRRDDSFIARVRSGCTKYQHTAPPRYKAAVTKRGAAQDALVRVRNANTIGLSTPPTCPEVFIAALTVAA